MRSIALLVVVVASSPVMLRAQAAKPLIAHDDSGIALSAIFLTRVDSAQPKRYDAADRPEHSVRNGAIIGAVVGGLYGAMIGTTRPIDCLGQTGSCDVSRTRGRRVMQWTAGGLVGGAVLGALIGETWAVVRSHRGA
jgi:hypothetical protein